MTHYSTYQSQFIEMFGDTPERVELSSLCETFIDGDWIEAKDQAEDGIRLIQTGNVGVGVFKDKGDKARYISEDTFERLNCTEVKNGDILVSRLPDPVGRACIIPEGLGKTITAVDCTIIRLVDKIVPKFFIAFTNTPDYAMQIKKVLSGTTRLRVSRANLGKIQVPLPAIQKQIEFVSIAEQADKSKFTSLKSQFIEMFGADTPVQKISDACDVRGGSTPSRTNSLFWDNGDVPWFTVEDIYSQGKYIRETKQHITKLATKKCFVYPKDTVLICCTASIGECALAKIEMASNQQFNGMMIKDRNKLDPQFLLYVSSTLKDKLLRQAGKTTIHFVSRNKLEEMQIPVPSMDKQQSFVAIMEQADKSKYIN